MARSGFDLEAERQESRLHEKGASLAVLPLLVFAGDVEVASLRLELSELEQVASDVNVRGPMNTVELEDPLRPAREVGAEESVERAGIAGVDGRARGQAVVELRR